VIQLEHEDLKKFTSDQFFMATETADSINLSLGLAIMTRQQVADVLCLLLGKVAPERLKEQGQ